VLFERGAVNSKGASVVSLPMLEKFLKFCQFGLYAAESTELLFVTLIENSVGGFSVIMLLVFHPFSFWLNTFVINEI